MHIEADTLDDLMREVLERLLLSEDRVEATRGTFTELFGVVLHLSNPRARLSRSEMRGKAFSALGEWLWYLSGANDLAFIDYYVPGRYAQESDDGVTVRSGYGERLRNIRGLDQIGNVIDLLRAKPTSRRAVIQLFDASDLKGSFASIPCTCTLQFAVRNGRLCMFVNMRSNDAYFGLPHDVFAFTMLQEVVARSVGVDVGDYKHSVGSLHLYEDNVQDARSYLAESWQSKISMPPMPETDPWPAIAEVREIERSLRTAGTAELASSNLDNYWKDICRLLVALRLFRSRDTDGLRDLRAQLSGDTFKVFIDAKVDSLIESRDRVALRHPDGANS
jgi:thymidylate synthase